MASVAINGMGRIGRAVLKIVLETPEFELAAMNDLLPPDNLAYLLRYDSVYGRYEREVTADEEQSRHRRKDIPAVQPEGPRPTALAGTRRRPSV